MNDASTILKGAYDMHLHSGPSLVQRSVDDVEAVQKYTEAGLAGVVIKDQYFMSTQRALYINTHIFKTPHTTAYGSVALNNSVGGLSPNVVDAAIRSGAKVVWMPTVSSERHVKRARENARKGQPHLKGVPLPKNPLYPETPLKIMDEGGRLLDPVFEIFDLVAKADIVLGSGHISLEEARLLVDEAIGRGVRKIIIDHPNILGYRKEDMLEMADRGALIELVAAVALVEPGGVEELVDLIKTIGPERVVLVSDLGQPAAPFPKPIDGLTDLVGQLLASGISEEDLNTMLKKNPGHLLGCE